MKSYKFYQYNIENNKKENCMQVSQIPLSTNNKVLNIQRKENRVSWNCQSTRNRYKVKNTDSIMPCRKPRINNKNKSDQRYSFFESIDLSISKIDNKINSLTQQKTDNKNQAHAQQHLENSSQRKRLTLQTESLPLNTQKNQLTYSYSFSSSEQNNYDFQKQLFARFMNSKNFQWIQIYNSMVYTAKNTKQMLDYVKIGEAQATIEQNRVLAHFVSIDLDDMGYRDPVNKQRILDNVEIMFNERQGIRSIAEQLYNKLFQGYLPCQLQIQVLLELCQRGWQYFTFFCCRYIHLITKHRNYKQHQPQLYEQFQKIITTEEERG